MNYTEKYHLPQWEETDRIMRSDFNQMCADLEGGIARAQDTADTARSEAAEAAVLPYIVGSYTGNGETIQVDIGFSPRFIIGGEWPCRITKVSHPSESPGGRMETTMSSTNMGPMKFSGPTAWKTRIP